MWRRWKYPKVIEGSRRAVWSLWHLKDPGELCRWQPPAVISTEESRYKPRFGPYCQWCDPVDPKLCDNDVPNPWEAAVDFELE